MTAAPPSQAPPPQAQPPIEASGMGDLPPFTNVKHSASMMHGRGKRTARRPSPATSQSAWMRTTFVILPIQPSLATMGKIERVHDFLHRKWTARQQQGHLHLQKGRTSLKRKVTLADNVSSSHTHPSPPLVQ